MALLRILAVLAVLAPFAGAKGAPDREHRVKAVFLFNFAQFVVWPDSAFAGPTDPLVVGILGDDPFDTYLDDVVRGEKVNNRPIKVKRYRKVEDARACHVLFVSSSEAQRMNEILAALRTSKALTVGESDRFFRHGGMVNFATESGRIRLKINLEEVQDAGLSMSSKLLRLADVTGSGRR